MLRKRALVIALAMAPGLCFWARAEDIASPSAAVLETTTSADSRLRWGAALKLLLPSLRARADRRLESPDVRDFHHIDGDDAYVPPPPLLHVTDLAARDVVEHGKPRLLVLVGVDPPEGALGMALLALIDPGPQPRLLDLVDVAGDRETYFDDSVRVKIAADADLIGIVSAHLSAGEDAALADLIYVRDDRLLRLAQIGRQSLSGCGFETRQTWALAALPGRGAEFDSLQVTVTETVKRTPDDCGAQKPPKPGCSVWRTVFKWDAKKLIFRPLSRDLDALQEHNSTPR